eukprot:tig00020553_g10712.t2
MPLFKPGRTDLLPPQRTSSASSANDARRALLQGGWLPVAAANARERIAVDLLVAFVAVAAEAKQGSGRDWPAQRMPLSAGRVAAGALEVHACGRSGAASASPSPSPSPSRSRSRESWPRGKLEPVCCSLSWPSGLGEVPHDLQRARAASLHALPSHVNP